MFEVEVDSRKSLGDGEQRFGDPRARRSGLHDELLDRLGVGETDECSRRVLAPHRDEVADFFNE
jgi:hypothetical protein